MVQVVVGVGSNTEREKNICAALDKLSQQFGDLVISPVYESLASQVKFENDTPLFYFNLIVAFSTNDSIESVKRFLQMIEEEQGRQRNTVTVSLDLDLLLYGDWLGELDGNAIPHHDITHCEYVLRPLADLFPDERHPIYNKTYSTLWLEYDKEKTAKSVDFVWNDCIVSNAGFLPPF